MEQFIKGFSTIQERSYCRVSKVKANEQIVSAKYELCFTWKIMPETALWVIKEWAGLQKENKNP